MKEFSKCCGMSGKELRRIFAFFSIAFYLSGCTGIENILFVKKGVDKEQVRLDWGLCGGNYSGDGLPNIRAADLSSMYQCMARKGYQTHSEATGIERVHWISKDKYDPLIPSHADPKQVRDERECGAEVEKGTGIWYVIQEKLPSMDRCMRKKGYTISLPPRVGGIQVR